MAGILPADIRARSSIAAATVTASTDWRSVRRAYELAVQMIFQDPFASLNPRMRVRDIIGEAPRVHGLVTQGGDLDCYVGDLMQRVGLDPASYRAALSA